MPHERVRHLLIRELPHHPLRVLAMSLAHFSHLPIYDSVRICTGLKMRVNYADGSHVLISLKGDCEPEVTEMMRASLSKGDTFVDGGANAGLKTGIGYSLVGETGSVIAIEPTPRTYALLTYNCTRWSASAIKTHQLALSDTSGVATLTDFGHRRSGLNTLNCTARDNPGLKGKTIQVKTTTLDELVESENPSLVKLDLEKYELQALKGFREHLFKYQPDIITETGNSTTLDALKFLSSFGYGFFGLVEGKLSRINTDQALCTLNVLATAKS